MHSHMHAQVAHCNREQSDGSGNDQIKRHGLTEEKKPLSQAVYSDPPIDSRRITFLAFIYKGLEVSVQARCNIDLGEDEPPTTAFACASARLCAKAEGISEHLSV